jgi:transposase
MSLSEERNPKELGWANTIERTVIDIECPSCGHIDEDTVIIGDTWTCVVCGKEWNI